jgi:hypothetical protein
MLIMLLHRQRKKAALTPSFQSYPYADCVAKFENGLKKDVVYHQPND